MRIKNLNMREYVEINFNMRLILIVKFSKSNVRKNIM
jgi:hypothetical protein